MIDEEATFEKFGYYPRDLSLHSKKRVVAVCDECGIVRIIPKGGYHALCRSCGKKGRRNYNWKGGKVKLKCDNCGKIIEKRPCDIKRDKYHFCNKKCRGEWRSKHLREKDNPNWKGGEIRVICDNCGKSIEKTLLEIKKHKHHFCDTNCHAEWQTNNIACSGSNHPSWKGGKIEIKCSNCEKTLRKDSNEIRTRKHCFCNPRCHALWRLENTNERQRLREIRAKIAKPTKPELIFQEICKKYDLPFRYVGDGQLWIGKKKKLNPDFIECNGNKVIIEVFGNYWHAPLLNRNMREGGTLKYRKRHYTRYHWKSIFFWEIDLLRKDAEQFVLSTLKREAIIKTIDDQLLECPTIK